MIKLPEDIEAELQRKFPNVHIKTVVQHIFQAILEKTLKDGSCHLSEFGKFTAFATFSTKLCREVLRFKFKLSTPLNNKIKVDEYLLVNAPVKAANPFDPTKKLDGEKGKINLLAQKEAGKIGKEKTIERLQTNEISSIVNDK